MQHPGQHVRRLTNQSASIQDDSTPGSRQPGLCGGWGVVFFSDRVVLPVKQSHFPQCYRLGQSSFSAERLQPRHECSVVGGFATSNDSDRVILCCPASLDARDPHQLSTNHSLNMPERMAKRIIKAFLAKGQRDRRLVCCKWWVA